MEHTAVQLMSRKQRAAKLLTGDIGLTGLDALTEGKGGFESALLDAIAKDDVLVDPGEMFKAQSGELDAEDAAYWNVEVDDKTEEVQDSIDPLIEEAIQLGAVIHENVEEQTQATVDAVQSDDVLRPAKSNTRKVQRYVRRYLDSVSVIHDLSKNAKLQAELLTAMLHGVLNDDETRKIVGLLDTDFAQYPVHEEQLIEWVRSWLKYKRYVFMGCEQEVAQKVVTVAKQVIGIEPLQLDVFGALQDMKDEQLQTDVINDLQQLQSQPSKTTSKKSKKTIDLMAIPEDDAEENASKHPLASRQTVEDDTPKQLAMF